MAKKRNRSNRKKKRQVIEIFVSCLVIGGLVWAGSLVVDLEMIKSVLSGDGGGGYQNVTLTDAQLACQEKARDRFGKRLRTITYDSHSSRYDKSMNRYKMFFNLDIYPKKRENNQTVNYYVNCFVHGSRGSVTHFESVENKPVKTSPLREPDGNIFGF